MIFLDSGVNLPKIPKKFQRTANGAEYAGLRLSIDVESLSVGRIVLVVVGWQHRGFWGGVS